MRFCLLLREQKAHTCPNGCYHSLKRDRPRTVGLNREDITPSRARSMSIGDRVRVFCERFGIRIPILLGPMAGACPPSLSIAVANAGGMGACGALTLKPDEILHWAAAVRASTTGPFQLNLWIPDS